MGSRPEAPVLGGTDTATASDQTSRQSADNRLDAHLPRWAHPALPEPPCWGIGDGACQPACAPSPRPGWVGPGESCLHSPDVSSPWPAPEVGGWLGPSSEGPCKHFTSCPSLALTLKPTHIPKKPLRPAGVWPTPQGVPWPSWAIELTHGINSQGHTQLILSCLCFLPSVARLGFPMHTVPRVVEGQHL